MTTLEDDELVSEETEDEKLATLEDNPISLDDEDEIATLDELVSVELDDELSALELESPAD
ncbi:MAG: hypothetical protein AAB962_00720 [Patescibacteria group bacterium]